MYSVHTGMFDPRPPSKPSPVPLPPSNTRLTHVTTATPAKQITFYKSGDSQFGGIRMAIHKRSFKCFDALLDDLSQKVPLPFGVRTVTTPRGTHAIKHLEQLQDGACYLCSDRRRAKPINMELANKRPTNWYHHSRRPQHPEASSTTPLGHMPNRQRRILLVKNSEPGMRRSVVLSRRSTRSLGAFLDEVSEVMQFHVRKLYTAEGRRIDSVQSLMTCPGVLVCVGREAFSPLLINFIKKSSEEKLPGLGSRTPGNGARSPVTQGTRSPPHGAQSRASEYSEGHESKKNVNFGLETKKSIIHPRSDSSNRSTRFSLSSDKSYGNGINAYSQARPAIMNDDIEKRVLVNKDGSLSVEMRVRFRLHNEETLQWSTQIKKSPSLTNASCPLSQTEPHYLQLGVSESCSDPDSTSFDPERVDYSNRPLQRALETNYCPCCYQRQELQYDLWENPAHSHKQPPMPPPHPHTSSHTHTVMRHTHSSSSSSSCNSRRMVRCRAQLSSCRGGSGSEQSQVVQEEIRVTEQVEHRVDVEQDGDTHVEMCKVSRSCSCTEIHAMDSNLQPLSRKSIEDEIEEEEAERPVSAISSSSHILQSLKEDQDEEEDDLPPSASQCCHCTQPSASPTSQVHLCDKNHEEGEDGGSRGVSPQSCRCRAVTPLSAAGTDNVERASSTKSKVSRVKVPNSEEDGAADDEDEEVKRVVSGFSGCTGLSAGSQKSGASSVCSACGGCKRGLSSASNSRASQRSRCSHSASLHPASPALNQENGKTGSDAEGSDDSAVSTQSNKTNLTNHEINITAGQEGEAPSPISRLSNSVLGGNENERAPSASSAASYRSKRSHRSDCNSAKSSCSRTAEIPNIRNREQADGENAVERAMSSLSAKSGVSEQIPDSVTSHRQSPNVAPSADNTVKDEKDNTDVLAPSRLSVTSNASVKSGEAQRPNSNFSAKSTGTAKSGASRKYTCSHCTKAGSPGAKGVTKETGHEEGTKVKERPVSAMSAKSNLSVNSVKSCKSNKASERSLSPRSEAERDGEERAASQTSARSVKSNMSGKSSRSCKADYNGKEVVESQSKDKASPDEEKEKMVEVDMEQRPDSKLSAKSGKDKMVEGMEASKSSSNTEAASEKEDTTGTGDEENVSREVKLQNENQELDTSPKSRASLKSVSPSHNVITIKTPEGFDEKEGETRKREPSVASVASEKSSVSSHRSNVTADAKVVEDPVDSRGQMLSPRGARSPRTHSPRSTQQPTQQLLPGGEKRGPSALSVRSTASAKSGRSKCRCGTSLAKKGKGGEDREVVNEGEKEDSKTNQISELAASIKSTSSKRQRRESGGTEQLLSQNSSESVSLGLPGDLETAESDRGTPVVSFKDSVKLFKSPEDCPSVKDPAVDIPTIETPGESKDEEGGEPTREATPSANSAKSGRSCKSSCKCSIKAAARKRDSKRQEERSSGSPTKVGNDLETEKGEASNQDACENQASPPVLTYKKVSGASSPVEDSAKSGTEHQAAVETEDAADNGPCSLGPESAVSSQSKQSKGESPVPGRTSKSKAGSSSRSVKTPSSQKKESPNISPSKVETCSESTLSHSLSAADLLRETMAAARPRSCQSKATKTSEKSARCQRNRKQNVHVEELEVTPACLPNVSPNDVVSEWLRNIPANSSMLALDDELNELEQENEVEDKPAEEVAKEEKVPEDDRKLDGEEETQEIPEEEGKGGESKCDAAEEDAGSPAAPGEPVGTTSCPNTLLLTGVSLPRNWHSSAAVMKVLLSSSLGRCRSMPEVSPVYGRRLSTSARGLLDCLAQLQLIEPALNPGSDPQKDSRQQYEDIMAILQSLWLTEPRVKEVQEAKESGAEQVSPPRSSSGVDMSCGSGGSGKENGNQADDETPQQETGSIHEDEEAGKNIAEEKEGQTEEGDEDIDVEPEATSTEQEIAELVEEPVQSEEQGTLASGPDSPKPTGNPSSSDKSSANDSSKSPTDNEQETMEDTSSGTPPTVLRAPLAKRLSQDPDPVWVLHLLKKLEKQFINHYIDAMAEFKVRWDLDDNLILNTMIKELRDEVSRRIQSSIEREMRKIQSRAGKAGRSPRPPQGRNISRESTMTEKRRRMLKVMKNQSVKTADTLSDEDLTGDFSDQRSDDDYCPCDACVRKKMAARPLKSNPVAAEAPVMMEFDLLKILQLKKSPLPADVAQPAAMEEDESEKSLEVVQEEEEEDETKEDIKADVSLEETIPEEERTGQDEDCTEAGDEEKEEAAGENEENSVGSMQQEEEEIGEEVQEDEVLENGEKEEEEGEGECHCHSAKHEEESDIVDEGDGDADGGAEETRTNTAEDNEERAEEEEGDNAEDQEEAGIEEDQSDKETVKEATAEEGEVTGDCEEEEEAEELPTTEGENGEEEASGETEDGSAAENAGGNVSTSAEAEEEGEDAGGSHDDENGGETEEQEGETSEVEGASPRQGGSPAACVPEGEEGDVNDTECNHPSDTSKDESGREDAATTEDTEEKEGEELIEGEEVVEDVVEEIKPEEDEDEVNGNKKDEGPLLHQFTRTSVESQPGSMEDIDTD